jgi:hypothetical protein
MNTDSKFGSISWYTIGTITITIINKRNREQEEDQQIDNGIFYYNFVYWAFRSRYRCKMPFNICSQRCTLYIHYPFCNRNSISTISIERWHWIKSDSCIIVY